jgi:hypothetical protein
MSIVLEESAIPAQIRYLGGGTFSASAGQSLRIETSPSGEEVLSAEVPAGKSWAVTVQLNIVETDA